MTTLFDDVRPCIQDAFEAFHAENPHIFTLFCRYAEQARDAGHRRYSADALLHRLRWHLSVEIVATQGDGGFKLNDHFTSRYARKLMQEDARFAGFFELRTLKG